MNNFWWYTLIKREITNLYWNNNFICRKGVHIYNLGTGEGATVLQVIHAFSQASGKVNKIVTLIHK